MAKKTLNTENLAGLGAQRLAALVMDLVQGSAALQRRARLELSAAQGPKEVAADLRKRFVSLRRATAYIDWHRQKAFVKDLAGLVAMIESGVAPHDPDAAFDLLWSFLQLAPSIHARTDDSNGAVGDVMHGAMQAIAALAPRISAKPATLADKVLDAVAEAAYGEFDGIVPALAEALGPEGLEHLKAITEAWAAAPPGAQELAHYHQYGLSTAPAESARQHRKGTRSIILADIADLQGDVDAYMARYTPEQLTYGTIAPDVARRLLDAGRVEEALDLIHRARAAEQGKSFRPFRYELDEVHEECLARLGRTDALKQHLWDAFTQDLNAQSLRKYLKLLPDFEDIEAEDKALALAETHPHLGAAIHFLVAWPDHRRAARIIAARADELDGNAYDTLTAAADALEPDQPLAATLLRRAMISDALEGRKTSRYRHAARHLAECRSSAPGISDFAGFPSHAGFLAGLKLRHGRKYGFWEIVEG